jgi:PadR family transcriptional regulator PadR
VDTERRGQWLRGVLDLCVLGVLADGESYGYALGRTLEDSGLGPVTGGTLYPVLMRLQRGGLVAARWRSGDSGPARKYYRLTPKGRTTLREAAGEWQRFTTHVGALLERGT